MRARIFLSAAAGVALIGFGALTGSVIGGAFAQAPTQSFGVQAVQVAQVAQGQATAAPAPGNPNPGNNGNGKPNWPGGRGQFGGPGFGRPGGPRGGFAGPGPSGAFGFGGAATADQA